MITRELLIALGVTEVSSRWGQDLKHIKDIRYEYPGMLMARTNGFVWNLLGYVPHEANIELILTQLRLAI